MAGHQCLRKVPIRLPLWVCQTAARLAGRAPMISRRVTSNQREEKLTDIRHVVA